VVVVVGGVVVVVVGGVVVVVGGGRRGLVVVVVDGVGLVVVVVGAPGLVVVVVPPGLAGVEVVDVSDVVPGSWPTVGVFDALTPLSRASVALPPLPLEAATTGWDEDCVDAVRWIDVDESGSALVVDTRDTDSVPSGDAWGCPAVSAGDLGPPPKIAITATVTAITSPSANPAHVRTGLRMTAGSGSAGQLARYRLPVDHGGDAGGGWGWRVFFRG